MSAYCNSLLSKAEQELAVRLDGCDEPDMRWKDTTANVREDLSQLKILVLKCMRGPALGNDYYN